MGEVRSGLRMQESVDELDVLRGDIERWLATMRASARLSLYETHWAALEQVLVPGLAKARAEVPAGDAGLGSGGVYAACRRADLRVVFLRRLWRWYADRVDQRLEADQVMEQTLEAADELVWSCWKSTFAAAGVAPSATPLPFIDHRFTATATPRVTVPADLAAARDELLAAQVTRLPVPVIGLPALVLRRPWWLILLAHETGHHVQYDLAADPDLVTAVAGAVTAAASGAGAGADEVELWSGWSRELFADAYSAAMVGPVCLWAVAELEHRPAAGLARSTVGTYPPPLVRLAVLRAVLAELGAPAPPAETPDSVVLAELAAPPTDGTAVVVAAQLVRASAVASALLAAPLGGSSLTALGARVAGWYVSPPRAAQVWADELRRKATIVRNEDDSARQCAAGSVLAWMQLGAGGEPPAPAVGELAAQARTALRSCRASGTRASRSKAPDGVVQAQARLLAALDDPTLGDTGECPLLAPLAPRSGQSWLGP